MNASRKLDFIRGLILDVDGVLTDGSLYFGKEGEELKVFYSRDGLGLAMLREAGYRLALITGRSSEIVRRRAEDLKISECLMGRMDKATALEEVLQAWKLPAAEVAAIGDDRVDLPMLSRVGWSFAPSDADSMVLERVDEILPAPGGRGAVRQAAERILAARDEPYRFSFEDGSHE